VDRGWGEDVGVPSPTGAWAQISGISHGLCQLAFVNSHCGLDRCGRVRSFWCG